MIDPRSDSARMFGAAAGPPPPPGDEFDAISRGVPVAGPALAMILRALDVYSNAVPRKIFGSVLDTRNPLTQSPMTPAPLVRGAAMATLPPDIQQAVGMVQDPNARFDLFSKNTAVPFGGAIAESLSDPLLGVGPVARLGAPVRGLLGTATRGALGAAGRPITSAGRGVADLVGSSGFSPAAAQSLRATEAAQIGRTLGLRGGKVKERADATLEIGARIQELKESGLRGPQLTAAIKQAVSDAKASADVAAAPPVVGSVRAQKARSTLTQKMEAALGRSYPAEENFGTQIFTAKPGEDNIAQGFRAAASIGNQVLGGYPGRVADRVGRALTAPGRPLALSERQVTSDTLSNYGNLFNYLQRKTQGNLFDFYQLAKDLSPEQLRSKFKDMGIPDRLAELGFTDRNHILGAFRQAGLDSQKALSIARDVTLAAAAKEGRVIDLPMVGGSGLDAAQRLINYQTVQAGTRAEGINTLGDLARVAEQTYGSNSAMMTDVKNLVGKLAKHSSADPLLDSNVPDLVLGNALYRREQAAREASHLPEGIKAVADFARNAIQVEREQAVTSLPYLINNMSTRILGMASYGMVGHDVLHSTLEGMGKSLSSVAGKFRGLTPEDQLRAVLPRGATALADHLDIPVYREILPHRFVDLGDLSDAVNSLTSGTSRMTTTRMGVLFPGMYAAAGALAGGPVGAAVGGLTGAAIQKVAPVVYKLEGIADLFGRSEVWYREVGRYANQELIPFLDRVEGRVANNADWKSLVQKARNAPDPDQIRQLHESLLATNGLMSAKYVEGLIKAHIPGVKESVVKELTQDWANVLDKAGTSGVDAARKVMLIPRMRNLDDKLKWVLLFHTWAVRYVPWIATEMAAHPAMTATVLRVMADSNKEAQLRGLPDKFNSSQAILHPNTFLLGGLLHSLYGDGSLYWNPLLAVNPFQGITQSQVAQDEGDPLRQVLDFGSQMGLAPPFIARWALSLMGVMGPQAPSPEFFRHGQLLRDLPIGGTDINAPIRGFTDSVRRALGQDPADFRDYATRRRIREIAQGMGYDPSSPVVRQMETSPSHPVYQQAAADMQQRGLGQGLMSIFNPMPGGFKFMGTDEETNRAARAGAERQMGVRDDVLSILGPAVDRANPQTGTYSRLSFPPPTAPSLKQLISGQNGPRVTDPQRLISDYLVWVQNQGIMPKDAWDPKIVNAYLQVRRDNIDTSQQLRANNGQNIPSAIVGR